MLSVPNHSWASVAASGAIYSVRVRFQQLTSPNSKQGSPPRRCVIDLSVLRFAGTLLRGTAVLVSSPMGKNPSKRANSSEPVCVCANHCNLLNDGQDDVTPPNYI